MTQFAPPRLSDLCEDTIKALVLSIEQAQAMLAELSQIGLRLAEVRGALLQQLKDGVRNN